jgi:hypothetical protein
MQEKTQIWAGKAMDVATVDKAGARKINYPVVAMMTEEAARRIAMALASYAAIRAHQQYGVGGRIESDAALLLPEVQELLDALNYTLVGDPASKKAYRVLQAGKGMTPDGGFKSPQMAPGADGQRRGGKGQWPEDEVHQATSEERERKTNWRDEDEFGPRYS